MRKRGGAFLLGLALVLALLPAAAGADGAQPSLLFRFVSFDGTAWQEQAWLGSGFSGAPGDSGYVRFFYGTTEAPGSALAVESVQFVPTGSTAADAVTAVSVPAESCWKLCLRGFGSGSLRVTASGNTYSMPVTASVPGQGFFTALTPSESAFLPVKSPYAPGDVFYWLCTDAGAYVPAGGSVNVLRDGAADPGVTAELVETAADAPEAGRGKRQAVKITVGPGVSGSLNLALSISVRQQSGEAWSDGTMRSDCFRTDPREGDSGLTGGASLRYGGRDFRVGFTLENDLTLANGSQCEYPEAEEGTRVDSAAAQWISILSETEEDGIPVYTEEAGLYAHIRSVSAALASYDYTAGRFVPVNAADPYASPSFTISAPVKNAAGKWSVPLWENRVAGGCYLTATVTMDDGTSASFAMFFKAFTRRSETVALPAGETLAQLNARIAQWEQAGTKDIYVVQMPENAAYTGDLVLSGTKEIRIEGNGATLTGRLRVTGPGTADAPLHQVSGLRLVSALSGVADTADVGVSGSGNVLLQLCSFTGYETAVQSWDSVTEPAAISPQKIVGSCRFTGNHVGLRIDGKQLPQGPGTNWGTVEDCVFSGNDEAVRIETPAMTRSSWDFWRFSYCEFRGNTKDVTNGSIYPYLAANCFFADADGAAAAPKVSGILVSAVYREGIFDSSGLRRTLTLYPPLTADGGGADFVYENTAADGVNTGDFSGEIQLTGDYDFDRNAYNVAGTWDFGA